MKFEQMLQVIQKSQVNKSIYEALNEQQQDFIISILDAIKPEDMKELNPEATFDFTDIPLPIDLLITDSKDFESQNKYSEKIKDKLLALHSSINKKKTNVETPFFLMGGKEEYSKIQQKGTVNNYSCTFDWADIEKIIQEANENISIATLHTHPNPLGIEQPTLYNKYKEEFSKLGVMPLGQNLSLADVYLDIYLNLLLKKYNKTNQSQTMILMFNGKLVSFSTKEGLTLKENKVITNELKNEETLTV